MIQRIMLTTRTMVLRFLNIIGASRINKIQVITITGGEEVILYHLSEQQAVQEIMNRTIRKYRNADTSGTWLSGKSGYFSRAVVLSGQVSADAGFGSF